jgi:hypothetical protein
MFDPTKSGKRVAIVFFGIARGINLTSESIRKNIYEPNLTDGFSIYTIASLNIIEAISNPRTSEYGARLNASDVFRLNADAYALVRQDHAAIAAPLAEAQRQVDVFENEWISVRNTLHQLASLQRAWRFFRDRFERDFDYVLFVRPDLIYHDELRFSEILRAFSGACDVAVPVWHAWGGLNDRFAFADIEAARHYADRSSLVPEFCAVTPFHPERLLAHALARGRCAISGLNVRASRVRANGEIVEEDFLASRPTLAGYDGHWP